MGNPRHYAKHIIVRANGKEYPTLEGGEFQPAGKSREVVTGFSVHGYTETAQPAYAAVQVPANFETDFEEINDMTNVTVEVELDTGQIYLMANAWTVEPSRLNGGNFNLAFNSQTSKRIN